MLIRVAARTRLPNHGDLDKNYRAHTGAPLYRRDAESVLGALHSEIVKLELSY
jgi:hypothetical protein